MCSADFKVNQKFQTHFGRFLLMVKKYKTREKLFYIVSSHIREGSYAREESDELSHLIVYLGYHERWRDYCFLRKNKLLKYSKETPQPEVCPKFCFLIEEFALLQGNERQPSLRLITVLDYTLFQYPLSRLSLTKIMEDSPTGAPQSPLFS